MFFWNTDMQQKRIFLHLLDCFIYGEKPKNKQNNVVMYVCLYI